MNSVSERTDMISVTLAGCGTSSQTMTPESLKAVRDAHLVIGAKRLLSFLPEMTGQERVTLTDPLEIAKRIANECDANRKEAALSDGVKQCGDADVTKVCVLYSGDSGFYSGAAKLIPLLASRGIAYTVLPGVSSIQRLAARMGVPWQDWNLVSAHGLKCDPVIALMQGKDACFLTGTTQRAQVLCRELTDAGLGGLAVVVGEHLDDPDKERFVRMTAGECAAESFSPLSVMWAEKAPVADPAYDCYADEDYIRGNVPMTKSVVRAAIVSSLRIRPEDCVWDVGAGTGSVSVALALKACAGRTYAVEYGKEACGLIALNRARFGAWNLCPVAGQAPEALKDLPAPDAVFIGGTGGYMQEILDAVFEKNKAARVCISAIALETLSASCEALAAYGYKPDVTQIAVSRTKEAGAYHMLTANNPVFLIRAGA